MKHRSLTFLSANRGDCWKVIILNYNKGILDTGVYIYTLAVIFTGLRGQISVKLDGKKNNK